MDFKQTLKFLETDQFSSFRLFVPFPRLSAGCRSGAGCQVKEWQQQLLQQLGAETCELLRKRGLKKAQAAKSRVALKSQTAEAKGLGVDS